MKKIKTFFCALILSTCLVGNVFAGGGSGSGLITSWKP
jgi:hypothetical protein